MEIFDLGYLHLVSQASLRYTSPSDQNKVEWAKMIHNVTCMFSVDLKMPIGIGTGAPTRGGGNGLCIDLRLVLGQVLASRPFI